MNDKSNLNLTPMMKQYMELKKEYPEHILLFRLGDFYEMFFDDAIKASKILGIVLTKRDCGNGNKAPMCGIPHHVSEEYIEKIIKSGNKVAIAEQLENPKEVKGLVKRGIIDVVTPGSNLFNRSSNNNFLMSIIFNNDELEIAYTDISTGKFYIQ